MTPVVVLFALLVAQVQGVYNASLTPSGGFWRLTCRGRPVYTGRADSIVNPGGVATHVHKVFGGSGFSAAQKTSTPLQVFQETFNGGCSSCALQEVDNSNYWHPELYWQNQTSKQFQVVPSEGAIIYYFSSAGAVPFPDGLRMLAGTTTRRNYNGSLIDNQAVSYTCLQNGGAAPYVDDGPGFPTKNNFCNNILRAQIWFPSCWDGVNLDSADHKSHIVYPLYGANDGPCPADHPVRVPAMFWELIYDTGYFPHGNGVNPFVWSNGDNTGFGLHGDFVNGWNSTVLYQALHDSTCGGGQITDCDTLRPYVYDYAYCPMDNPIYSTEDVGLATPITYLPGDNPVTGYGAPYVPSYSTLPTMTNNSLYQRVTFRSASVGGWVTSPFNFQYGALHVNTSKPWLDSVWNIDPYTDGTVGIRNSANGQYLAHWTGSAAFANGNFGSAYQNTWYTFKIVTVNDTVAIQSVKDGTYLQVDAASKNTYFSKYNSPDASSLFFMERANGGQINPLGDPVPTVTAGTRSPNVRGGNPDVTTRSAAGHIVPVIGAVAILALLL